MRTEASFISSTMEKEKREFRRWILSSIDLDQAIGWANIMLENQLYEESDNEVRAISRGLHTAMIVAYSRPFSGNYNRGHTTGKLNAKFLEIFDEDEKDLHNHIIELRHQVFAHTDSEVRDLKINVADIMGVPYAIPLSRNPYISMTRIELERFQKMAQKLRSHIFEEVIRVQERLKEGDNF